MAYTFEQSYYFRPYRGNSSFWLNRYGNGSIASHQKATLYTAAGSADQRLKVHKVSGGCQLLSDLNNAYGLNIYGTKAGSVCDFYPVSGNFNDALIDLLTVDAANNLYRIKMINHNLYLTPASNSSGAALTWENASNADNQIWQLCASQSSGGGSTGGSTTITMPVNANQNYSGNSSWIINYGCAVCCGVDLASWKKNKSYTISDFANYYDEANGYTRQGLLEFGGCFFVCGSGRQPIQRDKTVNDNYYLLTLAAIAKEIHQRGLPPECSVRIAAGLPLTSFGRDKPKFKDYLLRSNQPVNYKFEGVEYSITIEEVAIFPQGYASLMTETGLLQDEPSMLLMDLGGWTVDLMRIDNAIPAADTAHSLELGMIRCVDDIREQVRRETGLSLTDAQIENMLAGHPCTVSDTVRDIVNKQGRKYTEHLLSATMEAGFDLHAIPAVLLGGGASVVSRHLSPKDGLCKTIFLLDDKVNAVGFERALAAVSRRKSEV